MDQDLQKSLQERFRRIRARQKLMERENIPPDCPCGHCGRTWWERDSGFLWYCFICGNRGYWKDGSFVQTSNRRGV